jgi:phenylacetic acid degradation operon negative regulatory protein
VTRLLKSFARRKPVRAGSLIVSLFGDVVSQHGNSVWLGSLIGALAPFGVNARQVRTAVFRLVRERWLAAERDGRRSYYNLTASGTRQYQRAAARVYAAPAPCWDGRWTLVVTTSCSPEQRDELRRELRWLGYGVLAPGVLAHPSAARDTLDELLREQGAWNHAIVLEAGAAGSAPGALHDLVNAGWELERVAGRYRHFVSDFEPLDRALAGGAQLADDGCFAARLLLIHEYRRILLHDSDLPAELLPAEWPGFEAAALTARLYRKLDGGAVRHLRGTWCSRDGKLPPPGREHFRRFGGLSAN